MRDSELSFKQVSQLHNSLLNAKRIRAGSIELDYKHGQEASLRKATLQINQALTLNIDKDTRISFRELKERYDYTFSQRDEIHSFSVKNAQFDDQTLAELIFFAFTRVSRHGFQSLTFCDVDTDSKLADWIIPHLKPSLGNLQQLTVEKLTDSSYNTKVAFSDLILAVVEQAGASFKHLTLRYLGFTAKQGSDIVKALQTRGNLVSTMQLQTLDLAHNPGWWAFKSIMEELTAFLKGQIQLNKVDFSASEMTFEQMTRVRDTLLHRGVKHETDVQIDYKFTNELPVSNVALKVNTLDLVKPVQEMSIEQVYTSYQDTLKAQSITQFEIDGTSDAGGKVVLPGSHLAKLLFFAFEGRLKPSGIEEFVLKGIDSDQRLEKWVIPCLWPAMRNLRHL